MITRDNMSFSVTPSIISKQNLHIQGGIKFVGGMEVTKEFWAQPGCPFLPYFLGGLWGPPKGCGCGISQSNNSNSFVCVIQ